MAADTPLDVKLNRLDPFREVNNTFPKTAQIMDFKQQGKKAFGWLCTYVPEEIIHAAGALPIRITGYKQEMELEDGYTDATGDYFITIDNGRCDGCDQCVTACAPNFVMAKDDSGQIKTRVKEEARKRLSILCPGLKSCTLKPNCHDACPRAATSHSW